MWERFSKKNCVPISIRQSVCRYCRFPCHCRWVYTSSMFLVNVASLRIMFEWISARISVCSSGSDDAPARGRKKRGTIELLTTKPLHDWEIVAGKFLAAWAAHRHCNSYPRSSIILRFAFLGDIDNGPVNWRLSWACF